VTRPCRRRRPPPSRRRVSSPHSRLRPRPWSARRRRCAARTALCRCPALLPAAAGWINLSVALYVAWYAYRSMRGVYGLSRRLTLSKLAVLAFFYVVSGSLVLAIKSIYSALTL